MNRTKLLRVMVIIALTGLAISLTSCNAGSQAASTPENQVVTIQCGDITVDITAAGNLSFTREEDLAFNIAGTLEEVLVEVGDSVEEGQVLAKLDTSEWEEQLSAVELDLIQAQINFKNAEIALVLFLFRIRIAEVAVFEPCKGIVVIPFSVPEQADVKGVHGSLIGIALVDLFRLRTYQRQGFPRAPSAQIFHYIVAFEKAMQGLGELARGHGCRAQSGIDHCCFALGRSGSLGYVVPGPGPLCAFFFLSCDRR